MGEENKEDERLSAIVTAATAAGVKTAVADPDTWAQGIDAMRKALRDVAQKEAGSWLLGWLKWVVDKLILGVVLGVGVVLILYAVGGWPLVVAYFKVKP